MDIIYIVEDETTLSELLKTYLVDEGYQVKLFNDGLDAKQAIHTPPSLWVLDIMLPGLDGYGLIKEIKSNNPDIPVIFMSARNAELDRVIGLEMGSDDYLPKPFLPRELVLRINRLLSKKKTPRKVSIEFGHSVFDISKRKLLTMDNEYQLTTKEFDLLTYLFSHAGEAKSRNDILDAVWGMDYFGSERVVDDTLRRLRKKAPELPLETVYGFGYMMRQDYA